MTIRAQFPRTSAAYPGILDWDRPLDWSDATSRARILGLVIAQRRAAEAGVDRFLAFCDAVADDIGGLVPVDEISFEADTIDQFRFLFGLLPIELTLSHGMNGDCYGWVMWTIARGCDRRGRVFNVRWSFFPPDSLGADDYHALSLKYLPRWADAVFLLARKFGGLDEVATAIADLCGQACHDALLLDVDSSECFAGLTSLANWAVNAGAPQAERWVRILMELWDKPLTGPSRARIGILMITEAHRYTGRDVRSWALELLDEWRPLLTEHLLLQVLASSVASLEDWTARRTEIFAATSDLADFYRGTPRRHHIHNTPRQRHLGEAHHFGFTNRSVIRSLSPMARYFARS